jgi:leader peptidase (prepilin peptidase)/N-methyltransferase
MKEAAVLVFAALTGAVVGSFLNVVIWRLPRGESLSHPRSRCPRCGTLIRWFDNVPVLSWLLLRARCRSCRAPISARYPGVELLTAALFLLAALRWPGDLATASVVALGLAGLVAISFIDLDHRIIPDRITKPGMVLAVALAPVGALHPRDWLPDLTPGLVAWLHAGAGLLVGYGSILAVRLLGRLAFRKEAMGLGDAKLLGFVGALTGPAGAFYTLVLACLSGAVVGILVLLAARRRPLPCGVRVVRAGGGGEGFPPGGVEAEGVRFRGGALVVPGPGDAPAGTPVRVSLTLPAVRVLEDQDAVVALDGRVEAAGGGAWRIAFDPPAGEDGERLELFERSNRYVPFGPFLSLGGAAVLLYGSAVHWWITEGWPGFVRRLAGG